MSKDKNRFLVKCYCDGKTLIDISVDNDIGSNYVSALHFSDVVSFGERKYRIENAEMKHNKNGPLTIELIVNLIELK